MLSFAEALSLTPLVPFVVGTDVAPLGVVLVTGVTEGIIATRTGKRWSRSEAVSLPELSAMLGMSTIAIACTSIVCVEATESSNQSSTGWLTSQISVVNQLQHFAVHRKEPSVGNSIPRI